jgi:hypothetical protein
MNTPDAIQSTSQISRKGLMRGVVVSNEDPLLEGRVALNVPKFINMADPKKIAKVESTETFDLSNLRNTEIKEAISQSVKTANYYWFRPVFNNCFLVPYAGQVVYCFFEDGCPSKAYYYPQSATLNGEVIPMDKLKATSNRFDVDTKPKIHVFQEYKDGTIVYHDENVKTKRFAITFKNNHSISINENPEENNIEIITESNHIVILNQKDKQILIKSAGGHTVLLDDISAHIEIIASSGGHIKMGSGSGPGTVNING